VFCPSLINVQGHDLGVTKVKPTVNTILVTPKSDLGVEQTDLSPHSR